MNIKLEEFKDQLANTLKRDLEDLSNLQELLSAEKHHLIAREHQAIDQITQQKDALIKQIESRAKAKAKMLASSGLGIKPGEVTQSLAQLNSPALSELWQQSVDKLKHCKEQNEVNGRIIAMSLSRTNKLMSIIRGQSSVPALYGQQGKTHAVSGSHVLGKA